MSKVATRSSTAAKGDIEPRLRTPVQIVRYNAGAKKFEVNRDAFEKMNYTAEKSVKVISIVGKYRTGKSFLLNKLLNLSDGCGFEVTNAVRGLTKGIWMAVEERENFYEVVLDTEGLFDVKNDEEFDKKLFVLILLCSSLVIYNLLGAVDQTHLEKLSTIATLSDTLVGEKSLRNVMPMLMFLSRDFGLEIEGEKNEYFLDVLETSKVPEVAEGIKKHFFGKISYETLPPNQDTVSFLSGVKQLTETIRNISPVKFVLEEKKKKECSMSTFLTLLNYFTTEINSTAIDLGISYAKIIRIENEKKFIKFAKQYYEEKMRSDTLLTEDRLVEAHNTTMDHILLELKKDVCDSPEFNQEISELFGVFNSKSQPKNGKILEFWNDQLSKSKEEQKRLWKAVEAQLIKVKDSYASKVVNSETDKDKYLQELTDEMVAIVKTVTNYTGFEKDAFVNEKIAAIKQIKTNIQQNIESLHSKFVAQKKEQELIQKNKILEEEKRILAQIQQLNSAVSTSYTPSYSSYSSPSYSSQSYYSTYNHAPSYYSGSTSSHSSSSSSYSSSSYRPRAPAGGTTVNGKFYKGGQFIPRG